MLNTFKLFFQSMYQSATRIPLTLGRLRVLIPFGVGYPAFAAVTWTCLTLDKLLYPRLRKAEIEKPVFIIGNPRSGTTLLHRLIALDREQFAGFTLGEIFLPALTQQRCLGWLRRLDRAVGGPVAKLADRLQVKVLGRFDHIHQLRLDAPEEDELLLMHAFSTPILMMVLPGARVLRPFMDYDALPLATRQRIDRFYRSCVQRLMYNKGNGRRFLSKNTAFGAKIRSLIETFPDARIIYVIRNPVVSIASTQAMFRTAWQLQAKRGEMEAQDPAQKLLDRMCHLYRHALLELDKLPSDSKCVVEYEALRGAPEKTVLEVYRALNLEVREPFVSRLREACAETARFSSKHRYTLEEFGLNEAEIKALLPEVYERFSFEERMGSFNRTQDDERAS